MAFKFIALFAFIAVASALPQHYYQQPALVKSYQPVVAQYAQPIVKKVAYEEHEAPANYNFEYSVHDEHTGDVKSQHETAKDGSVEGYYTLIDADGYRRVVHYTADDHNGFVAKVEREPLEGQKIVKVAQPVVAKVAVPVAKVQTIPYVQKYAAPAVTEVKYPVNNYYDHHY
ncbi:larval cuticle protein A2B-like [Chironomus tepperi]|uniref:larval cuticle protein A2B-like n=1 Tax=Chironomus tepperi TaxID=113505 RepID=UPI00391F30F5